MGVLGAAGDRKAERMKRIAKCPVCGTIFIAERRTQKYCSSFCRRYAHRYGLVEHAASVDGANALRTFQCVQCGKVVSVADERDKRTKFCSAHCERLYWKHSQHVKPSTVVRTFHCKNCGILVEVRDAKDKRTAFCSAACRIQWFSLHRKHRQHDAIRRNAL